MLLPSLCLELNLNTLNYSVYTLGGVCQLVHPEAGAETDIGVPRFIRERHWPRSEGCRMAQGKMSDS